MITNEHGRYRSYGNLDQLSAEQIAAKIAGIAINGVFGDVAIAEAIAELKLKDEGMNSLLINGQSYRVDEWLTPNDYAQKYEKPLETVMAWIRRESLPADRIVKVEKWKLTLLKDEPFEPASRGRRRVADD
jgi:hypothetical protein